MCQCGKVSSATIPLLRSIVELVRILSWKNFCLAQDENIFIFFAIRPTAIECWSMDSLGF